jgi:AcrR family transcriptional regulator
MASQLSHNAPAIVRNVSHTFASRRSANRRRRSEAREQILDVARRELKAKPFRDLSVDELMQATGLSRTAFYRYFPDREAVLVDLLEEVWGALAEARDVESAGEDLATAASMAGLSQLLEDNRGVLKAIADAAPGDEDVETTYRAFMRSYWIDDLTDRIVAAQRHGLAGGLDPELAGEALGWMAERMVTQTLDRDPRQVLDTIIGIIAKTIYSGPGVVAPPATGLDEGAGEDVGEGGGGAGEG